MQLLIVHNPHAEDPGLLWKELGPKTPNYFDEPMDRAGMEALKGMFNKPHNPGNG